MVNKVLEKETETIEFKLAEVRIIKFSETNYTELGLSHADLKEGICNIGFNLKIDDQKGSVDLPMLVEFFAKSNDKDYKLFSIETLHRFRLKKINEIFKKDEKGMYKAPDDFIMHILGIAIGGTRGMLVASHNVPEYKKIILPLIVTAKLLESYRADKKIE